MSNTEHQNGDFEVADSPPVKTGEVFEKGFSRKLRDPYATRLFLDELARQKGRRLPTPLRETRAKGRARPHPRQVSPARDPLIGWDDVNRAFLLELGRVEIRVEETRSWEALLVQTRISRLEQGTSTSPERQLENVVAWSVRHRLRPVHLVHEEVSGAIFRRRRRVTFIKAFDDLEHDRIVDRISGQPVKHIACFLYERFTRDPEEGGDWLRLMRRKGINLYETYYDEAPEPLYRIEHGIRDSWNRASKEVERNRERIMNALEARARLGLPTYGTDNIFGHIREVDPDTGKTLGYRADPRVRSIIEARARELIAGASIYSVQCWLNDNGVLNVNGGRWAHRTTERLFRAPRLAGLVRLKTDRSRLHDPGYEGDLYPLELIYEDGQQPPAGFAPPIEPLFPYPLWRDLQEALDGRKRKHGPHEKRFASGYLSCSECDRGLVGGTRNGLPVYRCSKRHLDGTKRSKAQLSEKIAHDGKRHPVVPGSPTDRLIEELIFAAVDCTYSEENLPGIDLENERTRIEDQLAALDERQGDLSHMLFAQRIARARYDEWLAELDVERALLCSELKEIGQQPAALIPAGVTLRDLWPEMSLSRRRQWIEIVFDRIVVKPAPSPGSTALCSRFEFVFRAGYEPPEAEAAELIAKIESEHRRRVAHNRIPAEIEERIFALHLEGNSVSQIGAILRAETASAPKSNDTIRRGLLRACRERGVEYTPNRHDSSIPLETRELMLGLYTQLRSYAAVARELNGIGLRRPSGMSWDSRSVGPAVRAHARRFGAVLPEPIRRPASFPRPTHLSAAMRERIWRMRRQEGLGLAEIAQWLKGQGIRTAGGKEDWNLSTIHGIVASVERQHAATAQTARQAA
jgi:hypothetical protein